MSATLDHPPSAPPLPASTAPGPRRPARRNGRLLALAWLRGTLHAAVFHRQALVESWTSPAAVRTPEEFAAALDAALRVLSFDGAEALLLLEHAQFTHRIEPAPSSSAGAARSYLRARVAREEQQTGRTVWCAQGTASARQTATFVLHLLPAEFFGRINQILSARRLALTRVFPLGAALQLQLDALAAPDQSMLIAAETGEATTIVVGWGGGRLAFARTLLASWSDEPGRVGGEINRSLLYAKQQLGTVVNSIRLFGDVRSEGEVRARCGDGREIATAAAEPLAWLRAVAPLSPRSPHNLLGEHLRRQRRRQYLRAGLAAACWLGLAALAMSAWDNWSAAKVEQQRFDALQARSGALRSDRDRLTARNRQMIADRDFIAEATKASLPPIPGRFLGYLAGILPGEIRLTDFQVQRQGEPAAWSYRLTGTIAGDENTAQTAVAALQQQLEQGPWHAPVAGPAPAAPAPLQATAPGEWSFNLGGTLLEN